MLPGQRAPVQPEINARWCTCHTHEGAGTPRTGEAGVPAKADSSRALWFWSRASSRCLRRQKRPSRQRSHAGGSRCALDQPNRTPRTTRGGCQAPRLISCFGDSFCSPPFEPLPCCSRGAKASLGGPLGFTSTLTGRLGGSAKSVADGGQDRSMLGT